jgi:protein-L-isoaspartate(D-aspartate) O-methyltransferase
MCEQQRAAGRSKAVIDAMAAVPRHHFAPITRWRVAYLDLDLWTGATWMTRPGTVARVVDALPREPGLRILEIGTGTGYQAALFATLGAEVVSYDLSPSCTARATQQLEWLGNSRISVKAGNGLKPDDSAGEFDAIVVNGVVTAFPTQLWKCLRPSGGVIVVPLVSSDGTHRLLRYASHQKLSVVDLGPCRFAPLLSVREDEMRGPATTSDHAS